ncbi:hypothetical protein CK203_064892 [Vitis vinifera]|uniref:Uncharacterized protein n=1 Tax=Vitis vinifera TaxID=29760 RepID=A0A438FQ68_VITVI|nr:hypothetical protein CK203_064892 [Vitis vinifera]
MRTSGHRLSNFSESTMAKTRGTKTPSPSGRHRAPRVVPVQDSMIEPSQPPAVPPSIEEAPLSSPLRRYETRRPPTTLGASSSRPKKSASRPFKKKARISAPVEPLEPSPEPQPPTTKSQIPSRMTPEVIIRRPMVTQPPIEGNLDCRARPFHSELCFDKETFRLQPKPRDSFHLLQRYHLEHLMTPRDFFYPRVKLDFYQSMTTHRIRDPTIIHLTIDGCHGILGARHIAETLRIPYEPARPKDYRVWAHHSQSDMVHILSKGTSTHPYLLRKELPPSMFFIDALLRHNIYPLQHKVQRRGALLEALFRISEGLLFGPHHLIMDALLYFEEKVHKKKLLRVDSIRLLFPRFLCQILEHLGYPSEPQL